MAIPLRGQIICSMNLQSFDNNLFHRAVKRTWITYMYSVFIQQLLCSKPWNTSNKAKFMLSLYSILGGGARG